MSIIESLYKAVKKGDTDTVVELMKKGVNVNLLSSVGRTALGMASQDGNASMVCLLLDAGKFYPSPPEEEDLDESEVLFYPLSPSKSHSRRDIQTPFTCYMPTTSEDSSAHLYKCCSPSIDSEACTCSDEVWGIDTSDTNVGQGSDIETGEGSRHSPVLQVVSASQPTSIPDISRTPSIAESDCHGIETTVLRPGNSPGHVVDKLMINMQSIQQLGPPGLDRSNIGYYIYEHKEKEEEDTGESSGPVVSSTEDSDSALAERQQMPPPIVRQSIMLHRSFGRGRANIVSSDSEFETENLHRKRQARHNHHRSHRHDREHCRHKTSLAPSYPFFSMLHSEYIAHGLQSPFIVKRFCDVNQHDIYGRSPLHYAAQQGYVYITDILITAGARIDAIDADRTTALHLAAEKGLPEAALQLLDAGANVNNKMNDKSSPLHIAASRGYSGVVTLLLESGAKIDSLDSSDRTPLLLAVSRAHYNVVKILIENNASVNIEEIHGYTPLCEAVWQRDLKLVKDLLEAGAKITQSHCLLHHAVLHRHCELVEVLLGAGCIPNLRDEKGDTPLIIAARTCQPNVIELLLHNDANVNYPNGLNGASPLHEAVAGTRDAQYDDFFTVFQLLRKSGARIDDESLVNGDTPLYRALILEKNRVAFTLIREGCNVNLAPRSGYTDYLQIACSRGNAALAYLIVLAGMKTWKCRWLHANFPADGLAANLKIMRSNPLLLSDQCRIRIRRMFGRKITSVVDKLSLPPILSGFLLLQEFADIGV